MHRAGAGRRRRLPRLRPLLRLGRRPGRRLARDRRSRTPPGGSPTLVPIALAAWGVALIARPLLRAPTALNAGGDPGAGGAAARLRGRDRGARARAPATATTTSSQRFMVEHGGAVGEALYWASTTLFQRLGAHILALLMFVSGALLLTGTHGRRPARRHRAARCAAPGPRTREVARTVRTQRRAAPRPAGATRPATRSRSPRADPTEPIAAELDDEAEDGDDRGRGRETRSRGRRRRAAEADEFADERTSRAQADAGRRRRRRPAARIAVARRRWAASATARDHRVGRDRLPAAAGEGARARQGRPGARHPRPRGDREGAARVAAPLRRRGAPARARSAART